MNPKIIREFLIKRVRDLVSEYPEIRIRYYVTKGEYFCLKHHNHILEVSPNSLNEENVEFIGKRVSLIKEFSTFIKNNQELNQREEIYIISNSDKAIKKQLNIPIENYYFRLCGEQFTL